MGAICRCATGSAAGAGLSLLLGACATVPPDAGKNPHDPFERVNRQTYSFNDHLDRYLIKPLARGYEAVVPKGVRLCISSGFANMGEIRTAVNDILQAKPAGAATDTGRLVINSTLGVAGCFDVATRMGLRRRYQDFGLTLAHWGVKTGPYVVLPLLGPSTVRDAVGLVPDNYASPTAYTQVMSVSDRNILYGVKVVDTRANLLQATSLLDTAALDRYQFTRDSYFQHRTSLEYEGNPPLKPLEEDDSGESGPGGQAAPSSGGGPKPAPAAPTPPGDSR